MSQNMSIADALAGNLDPIDYLIACLMEDAASRADELKDEGEPGTDMEILERCADDLLEGLQDELVDALARAIAKRKEG